LLDNEAARLIISAPALSDKVKHIEIPWLAARDYSKWKVIQYLRVHTALNVSDIFTKPLGYFAYGFLRFDWILQHIMYAGRTRVPIPETGPVPPPGCTADVTRSERVYLPEE
jgi:hypothetical protein